jgi:hypothetical protein
MPKYEPQTADEHFALQRTTYAAGAVSAAADAGNKAAETNRSANERFYNSLALFSSGTLALSITFLGYLKSVPKMIQLPHLLMASWICLFICVLCSLFWSFVYGYYSHYFHSRQYAEALKKKHEVEAEAFPTLAQHAYDVESRAPLTIKDIEGYTGPRLKAAKECGDNAKQAEDKERFYMRLWRWLGRVAQLGFLLGFGLLLAFAVRNM